MSTTILCALSLVLAMLSLVQATYQRGDRIPVMIQTYHSGWKSLWMEPAVSNMPHFINNQDSILSISLPRPEVREEQILEQQQESAEDGSKPKRKRNIDPKLLDSRINPEEDVKVSFTFADRKIILPQVVVFDADEKKSLKRLIVTFYHDKFDVLRLTHQLECKTFAIVFYLFIPLSHLLTHDHYSHCRRSSNSSIGSFTSLIDSF